MKGRDKDKQKSLQETQSSTGWWSYLASWMPDWMQGSAAVTEKKKPKKKHKTKQVEKKSKKKASTVSTTQKELLDEQGNEADDKTDDANYIPLMTFSTEYQRPNFFDEPKQPVETKAAKAKITLNLPEKKTDSTEVFSRRPPLWTVLKPLISRTHRLLITDTPFESDPDPMNQLIGRLAFLYRFHLMNLAIMKLTKPGEKFQRNLVRTTLMHNMMHHLHDCLSNTPLLLATRESLLTLRLHELKDLCNDKKLLDCWDINADMSKLPLEELISKYSETDMLAFSKQQLPKWIIKNLIPLLNSLKDMVAKSNGPEQDRCDAACKMMIILIGEYCPKFAAEGTNSKTEYREYNQKTEDLVLANSGKVDDFIIDCRKLRNFYAHFAITDTADDLLMDFMQAAEKINNKRVDNTDLIASMLSPPATKPVSLTLKKSTY